MQLSNRSCESRLLGLSCCVTSVQCSHAGLARHGTARRRLGRPRISIRRTALPAPCRARTPFPVHRRSVSTAYTRNWVEAICCSELQPATSARTRPPVAWSRNLDSVLRILQFHMLPISDTRERQKVVTIMAPLPTFACFIFNKSWSCFPIHFFFSFHPFPLPSLLSFHFTLPFLSSRSRLRKSSYGFGRAL